MSTTTETFYGLRCDFPDCGRVYDGAEYTYWADPMYGADEAQDDGWLVIDGDNAYCEAHVLTIPCPDPDECERCWRGTDHHLIPMPDTTANRLQVIAQQVAETAKQKLDRLEFDLLGTGMYGYRRPSDTSSRLDRALAATDRALIAIWERACRAERPDITANDLWHLRRTKESTSR